VHSINDPLHAAIGEVLSATFAHHVPALPVVHSPEEPPPHPLTAIVADDEQRSDGQPE
jgi:hypothetical protein